LRAEVAALTLSAAPVLAAGAKAPSTGWPCQKAQTATTRAYAQKLITDHTKSLAEAAAHSGMSFDVTYRKIEVTDHFGGLDLQYVLWAPHS
jgi:hypothetical protein